ncbi:response regulator transcription factor [Williamsia maris]|uniref:DNA-binding response regulator, OmpR family, contains REC and winged-helix (WHTH) domain n=1 Tax=Williamsia maris TaxID=72806 RepID=A0ABT1HDV5_9NOCA|nr:response regulator transcription factor [Williamsia maris]MCP2176440.1 DNA-binding response regulator, OmpR family, contains REC and winged-helix (wHTH) domain [Williamsia maris]
MSDPADARPSRVLLADDNPVVSDVVRRYLERDGVEVEMVDDGAQALEILDRAGGGDAEIDLVILDVMMPVLDGLSALRAMRSGAHRHVPVILLTALGEEEDRVVGFEAGADDYVTKPFSPRELALRVASVLRRSNPVMPSADPTGEGASPVIRDGAIVLDPDARTVTVAGRAISTTKREFDLLAFFLGNPGVVFSREQLLSEVWEWTFGDMSTVTVHVKRLRAKLGDAASLETVWGQGYRWDRSR